MPRLLILAFSLLVLNPASHAADFDTIAHTHDGDLAAIASLLPKDQPVGTNASITLVSLKRVPDIHEPVISTFMVDYAPGGSAVLHRTPASGYVLVHVLAGAVRARAWDAGVGTYHAGETWVEPALASDISTRNASSSEHARVLVVIVTNEDASTDAEGE